MTAKEFQGKLDNIRDFLEETEARVRKDNKPDEKILAAPLPQADEWMLTEEKRAKIAAQQRIAHRAWRLGETYKRDLSQLTNELDEARFQIQQQLWICQRPVKYMGRGDVTEKYRELAAQFIGRAKEPKDIVPLIVDNFKTQDLCSEFIDQARAKWPGKMGRDFEKAVEAFEKAAGIDKHRAELEAFDALSKEVQELTDKGTGNAEA